MFHPESPETPLEANFLALSQISRLRCLSHKSCLRIRRAYHMIRWMYSDNGITRIRYWRNDRCPFLKCGALFAFDFIFKRYTVNVLSARWTYLLESSGFLKIDKKFEKIEDFKVGHSKMLVSKKIFPQMQKCTPLRFVHSVVRPVQNPCCPIVRIHPANHISVEFRAFTL